MSCILFDDSGLLDIDDTILGRVTDAFGRPLDDKPNLNMKDSGTYWEKNEPIEKKTVKDPLDVELK